MKYGAEVRFEWTQTIKLMNDVNDGSVEECLRLTALAQCATSSGLLRAFFQNASIQLEKMLLNSQELKPLRCIQKKEKQKRMN